ncbi:YciI family protein [Telmatocola sphagniphila]|uniref:YciI family protein n=1 Tax=Telmatocola sphagniphila TaxID=1123043 RepID=A0A8E6B7Y7_9BACT|nr:YciI-like protein [Telmatocola sphagniphila]QVL33149.1 YciI family protein [Telmatocola sphagniphila]
MHYLLFYDVVENYTEARIPFRTLHLEHARAAVARGELLLGGALAEPADGAVLLFQTENPQLLEDFAKSDPYVINKVVTGWRIRKWMTVVGENAAVQP